MFSKKVTKNKSLLIDVSKITGRRFRSIFDFSVSWTVNCDHAGFTVYVQLYKFCFSFELTDGRHWDYDNDRFEELK